MFFLCVFLNKDLLLALWAILVFWHTLNWCIMTPRLCRLPNLMDPCELKHICVVLYRLCHDTAVWCHHRIKITALSVSSSYLLFPFTHTHTHTYTVSQSEVRKGSPLLTWSPGWQGRSCHRGHRSSWGVSCGSSHLPGCFHCRCCVHYAAQKYSEMWFYFNK